MVDVSTRIIRRENLYDTLATISVDDKQELIGRNVITKYGTWKIYSIKKIDTQAKASSTFLKNGQPITYADYFKQAYGINLKYKDQKMILSCLKKKTLVEGKLVEK